MPRKTPEERLSDLTTKRAQLDARIQRERSKVRSRERKENTRRKIIAGALALEHMAHDATFAKTMETLLREHVKRDQDRELFGL